MRNPGGRLLKVLEWMWATVQRSRRTRGTCMFQPLQRHRVHQTLKSFWTVVVCLQDQSDRYHQHPHHKSTAYNELPVVNVTTTPSSVNPSSPPADWKMITCSLLSLHVGFKDGGRTYYCWPPQPSKRNFLSCFPQAGGCSPSGSEPLSTRAVSVHVKLNYWTWALFLQPVPWSLYS